MWLPLRARRARFCHAIPTREWRIGQGGHWNIGDTVVSGIGQGYIQVTPLQLATYVARVATGRAVVPHLTRNLGGVLQGGTRAEDWPALPMPQRDLQMVREGMWAVVNEQGGTAPQARLPDPKVQLAGKTGSAQVRRVSRELRENGVQPRLMDRARSERSLAFPGCERI